MWFTAPRNGRNAASLSGAPRAVQYRGYRGGNNVPDRPCEQSYKTDLLGGIRRLYGRLLQLKSQHRQRLYLLNFRHEMP